MDKNLYVTVAKSVKEVLPGIHLHAFSPEEIIYGAKRNKISVIEMISRLKDAGVNSFPGMMYCTVS
jgi:5-amino-6-(D-ribitylamino)uracil---L-tyrosine 4-hydroxyphenyl transferase